MIVSSLSLSRTLIFGVANCRTHLEALRLLLLANPYIGVSEIAKRIHLRAVVLRRASLYLHSIAC